MMYPIRLSVSSIAGALLLSASVGAIGSPEPAHAFACSVVDFGAVAGDGIDDTTEIQAALDAGCGPVDLPAGAYLISATLTVPSGGGIVGPGVLHQTADVTTILNSNTAAGNSDITLDGFVIDKNFVDNSLADGIRIERSTDIVVSGVEIIGISARSGIELLLCDTFAVSDNYLHDYSATATGVLGDGDPVSIDSIYIRSSDNGTVSGNRIEDMDAGPSLQTDGIFVSNAVGVHVTDNEIRNVGEGIDLGNTEDVLVDYNLIEDAQAFGLKVGNGSIDSTFAYNTVARAQMSGVVVFGGASTVAGNGPTENITVDRNVITDTGSDGTAGHPFPGSARAGVYVTGDRPFWAPVAGTIITDNQITDTQTVHTMQFGILVDEYTVGTTYVDNTISGHTVEGLRDLS
ncbi:right-handed parallel beta-helix repeat-containing protein [Microbacterium oxydans]|uniref:right-handed parallel beta-helix repeat-containing protein n=1 Tax=Microbacterium oxydans TaxID=82380 RepID=UPI000B846F25|nr:right-handed parallel beta-helix repeat-containing protein [Microbacterium oxydans]